MTYRYIKIRYIFVYDILVREHTMQERNYRYNDQQHCRFYGVVSSLFLGVGTSILGLPSSSYLSD